VKLSADSMQGMNAIARHSAEGVIVNGSTFRHNVLVPWRGSVTAWASGGFEALGDADFDALAALAPEVVVFGSGPSLRFPRPALLRGLMQRRIGFETMDTPAACRTYNVLLAEGRSVVAALLFAPPAGRPG
jgi:uncharacterized protein